MIDCGIVECNAQSTPMLALVSHKSMAVPRTKFISNKEEYLPNIFKKLEDPGC